MMANLTSWRRYTGLLREEYLKEKKKKEEEGGHGSGEFKFNDQLALRRLHLRFYPRIKADTMSWVMTRKDHRMDQL